MPTESVIGIDLGGTHVRAAIVTNNCIEAIQAQRIDAAGTYDAVLQTVYSAIDAVWRDDVKAIGIGVPSVIDLEMGIVYDVQNIPAWREVPLKAHFEERYKRPTFINNDANCFALGEFYFGAGSGSNSMIGLSIGTGLGAGIILNKKLYCGHNCGAGEFGMVGYKDKFQEWYASGSFFKNVYGVAGEAVFAKATEGNAEALRMYHELGVHLGHAIETILYTYDPERIVLGGSVAQAYQLFQKPMWQHLQRFAYQRSVQRLQLHVSTLQHASVFGAAALYYDAL